MNAEKYFKMKKSDCKEALEIYKRFLTRVTKIGEFMKLAEVFADTPWTDGLICDASTLKILTGIYSLSSATNDSYYSNLLGHLQ